MILVESPPYSIVIALRVPWYYSVFDYKSPCEFLTQRGRTSGFWDRLIPAAANNYYIRSLLGMQYFDWPVATVNLTITHMAMLEVWKCEGGGGVKSYIWSPILKCKVVSGQWCNIALGFEMFFPYQVLQYDLLMMLEQKEFNDVVLKVRIIGF